MHPIVLHMAGGNAVMHNKIVWTDPLKHYVSSAQASVNCTFHAMLIDQVQPVSFDRLRKKGTK